jgi:hypothetical protein
MVPKAMGGKDRFTDLFDGPLAQTVTAGEIGQRRGQSWSDARGPHGGRKQRSADVAAVGTEAGLRSVFVDEGREDGQVHNLEARRRRLRPAGLVRQRRVAALAVAGDIVGGMADTFGRQKFLEGGRMAGLSSWPSAALGFDDGLGRLRRIGRGGQRGVGSVTVEAFQQWGDLCLLLSHEGFEFGYAPLQHRVPRRQLSTSWTRRLVHADKV